MKGNFLMFLFYCSLGPLWIRLLRELFCRQKGNMVLFLVYLLLYKEYSVVRRSFRHFNFQSYWLQTNRRTCAAKFHWSRHFHLRWKPQPTCSGMRKTFLSLFFQNLNKLLILKSAWLQFRGSEAQSYNWFVIASLRNLPLILSSTQRRSYLMPKLTQRCLDFQLNLTLNCVICLKLDGFCFDHYIPFGLKLFILKK